MKKALSVLIWVCLGIVLIAVFYIFEIFPLNPGGPIISVNNPKSSADSQLPDYLNEDKIGRAKTYDEHINRGDLLLKNGYPALAISEYEAASRLSPEKAEAYFKIGKINYDTGDLLKAKVNFEEALKLSPDDLDAKIELGKTLIAQRKISEARAIFDGIQVHNQTSKYYQGMVVAFDGDHAKAKSIFNEVINIGGDENIVANSKNFLKAYEEFDSYQGGSPLHLKTLLGKSYIAAKEYEIAIAELFEVIKEKKDYRDAWILLGYAYLNIGKYTDAKDALSEARKLDPEKPEALFFLALSYYGLGDLQTAATLLESAKKNGYEPRTYVDQKLAQIYLELKKYKEAAQSYESLLSLNATDVNYFVKPIWIYIDRLNQPQKAVDLAYKAIRNHPDNAMSYNLLGWAFIGTNELMSAQTFLDKARSMDSNLDAVYLNYGKLYEKRGNISEAIKNLKKAFDLGKGNSISVAAADLYNKLISQAPDNSTGMANVLNPNQ